MFFVDDSSFGQASDIIRYFWLTQIVLIQPPPPPEFEYF